jgi:hypothetical protein
MNEYENTQEEFDLYEAFVSDDAVTSESLIDNDEALESEQYSAVDELYEELMVS